MNAVDIMSKNVITVSDDSSIEQLAEILIKNNVSGVPVVDDDNRVIGIVTEKDIMYKNSEPRFPAAAQILGAQIYLGGVKKYNAQLKKIIATSVRELMTKDVITVHEDDAIKTVVDLMLKHNINRIPVLDKNDRLCGIISRADIVKNIAQAI